MAKPRLFVEVGRRIGHGRHRDRSATSQTSAMPALRMRQRVTASIDRRGRPRPPLRPRRCRVPDPRRCHNRPQFGRGRSGCGLRGRGNTSPSGKLPAGAALEHRALSPATTRSALRRPRPGISARNSRIRTLPSAASSGHCHILWQVRTGANCDARRALYGRGDFTYNGIDRVDNALGYTTGNVVPCCKQCNHAKSDMPYADFMAWIARLTEYHWFHPEHDAFSPPQGRCLAQGGGVWGADRLALERPLE